MAHLSATRCTLTSVIARTPKCNTIRRYASSWYYNPTELSSNTTNTSGTWYNPTPSPPPAPPQRENINKEKVFIPPRAVRKETSTNPPRLEHCPGYYSFFRDLEHGFKHIPWPKKEDTHFHPDWMNGFKVIENYISQKEHDTFLAEVLEYSRKSHKVTHFDGRLVMNEMDTPFYHLFFNRLIDDGILEGPDRLAPNIYANGDVRYCACKGDSVFYWVGKFGCNTFCKYAYRQLQVEPDMGLTEFKDFVMMGSYGVWRHLDEKRGFTTLRQKVDLLTRFAQEHYPKQLPFFEKRFAQMAEHAEKHNL